MYKSGWMHGVLLAGILLSGGCDRIKSYLQGDDTSTTLPPPYSSGQGSSQPDRDKDLGGSPVPVPPRNEPIFYDTPKAGEFSILMDRFKKRDKAEDYSRYLRRQRINNFIYQQAADQYLVLVGHFVSRGQAEKQMEVLSRKGLGHMQIYPQ